MQLPKHERQQNGHHITTWNCSCTFFTWESWAKVLAGFTLSWYSALDVKKTCEAQTGCTSQLIHIPLGCYPLSLSSNCRHHQHGFPHFHKSVFSLLVDLSLVRGFSSNINRNFCPAPICKEMTYIGKNTIERRYGSGWSQTSRPSRFRQQARGPVAEQRSKPMCLCTCDSCLRSFGTLELRFQRAIWQRVARFQSTLLNFIFKQLRCLSAKNFHHHQSSFQIFTFRSTKHTPPDSSLAKIAHYSRPPSSLHHGFQNCVGLITCLSRSTHSFWSTQKGPQVWGTHVACSWDLCMSSFAINPYKT